MKTQVVMPRLSDAMEEGLITRWLVADGAFVHRGQEIVEIETDKATVGFEADAEGVLRHLLAEGQFAPVGQPIGSIEPAEQTLGASAPSASSVVLGRAAGSADAETPVGGGSSGLPGVSPLARRLARNLGVDLAQVPGSGQSGRVMRADVLAAGRHVAHAAQPATLPVPSSSSPTPSRSGHAEDLATTAPTDKAASRLRRIVAERMERAKREIPDFTVTMDVEMDAAVAHREQLKRLCRGRVPSLNDYVLRAVALALRDNPRMIASWQEGDLVPGSAIDVGIAVAVDDALFVPVVRGADARSLAEIAQESAELSGRARSRTLSPDELSGGTFTVSNLGMFGVTSFSAIINAPQSAILAVGALRREPVFVGDCVEPRSRMSVTLTCDHRVVYGAHAARFLESLREALALPAGL